MTHNTKITINVRNVGLEEDVLDYGEAMTEAIGCRNRWRT